ncbi:coniferyl-alcohol dehydrogenase [Phenylobacterium sp. LjRoot219]|uniref:coniferyl-alcohol dehydrogenase n=1 Tax=Phenylobacterium sp. LjRoot219 TaxID=3342283 RepID=UPI003ECD8618
MSDPFGYAGRRVIVSGCASGIGRATALSLVELGAEVHGLDVREGDVPLRSFRRTDLREPAAIEAAVAGIDGDLDALFNCAGIPPGGDPLDVMKVNFIGARRLAELASARMPAGGAIANVGSTGGAGWRAHLPELLELAETGSAAAAGAWCEARPQLVAEGYRFSKAAIQVWTLLSATRLIGRGVRVNCTIPGSVQTPMLVEIEKTTPSAVIDAIAQPAGRRCTPQEQAAALLFLNSPAASYVNGVALPVDGGFTASRLIG